MTRPFAGRTDGPSIEDRVPAEAVSRASRERLSLPLKVRRADVIFASYLVPCAAVRRRLPAAELRAARLTPARTVCSVVATEFVEGDLGAYHEVAILFSVREDRGRSLGLLSDVAGFLFRRNPVWVYAVPVTTAAAVAAGVEIWGFPKRLGRIEFGRDRTTRSCRLGLDDRAVLELRVPATRRFGLSGFDLEVLTLLGGQLRSVRLQARGAVRWQPGGAGLRLGDHPLADELRALGLERRALLSGFAQGASALIGGPEAAG